MRVISIPMRAKVWLRLGDETRDAPWLEEIERTARRGMGGAHTVRVDIEGDLQTPRPRDAVGELLSYSTQILTQRQEPTHDPVYHVLILRPQS